MEHHTKFGWKPDLPDHRDRLYSVSRYSLEALENLPQKVDLRETGLLSPIVDQGDIGACTAFSLVSLLRYDRRKQKLDDYAISKLFVYYNEREAEGTTSIDNGAELRTGIKVLATLGYCAEDCWPYTKANLYVKPKTDCYIDASDNKAIEYFRLNNESIFELKNCLASGFPFVFGATIYRSFYEADTRRGIVHMPRSNDQMMGGHAMCCVGYDDSIEAFIIKNSWGVFVGDQGYYYIPYAYMTNRNISDDFWTIRLVT